jgi:hypothetical protein
LNPRESEADLEPVAYQLFADGNRRPIFDNGQRQWVVDNDGNKVYGVWYVPREECDTPIVVGDSDSDDF